ncbi:MAG: putative bifunctional diguanylate cyclase/phosphodiesterase [Bosea sp. (in: a-proteobacteria)]
MVGVHALRPAHQPDPSPEPVRAEGGAGRILLVDDLFDNRAVLGRRLVRRGYEVVEAECGADALALIARERFDLVLLDVMMPGISGLDVLVEIRRGLSSQQLPVIMVTAKSFSQDVVEALQKGADDYITKPVDFDIALARIQTQISRKRATDDLALDGQQRDAALAQALDQVTREAEERRQSASTARYLATHDALTGVLNRAQFIEELSAAASEHAAGGAPYSVLFIDLDRFKPVNDTFGHGIGDKLLKQTAQRIIGSITPRDSVARFGGDEFLLLHCCDEGAEPSLDLAWRLIESINEPCLIDGHEISVGASIGIATPMDKNERPEETIGHADLAMYRSKQEGGSRVQLFDLEMAEAARRRLDLQLDLRFALKRNQLTLMYQPIIQLDDHTIVGFEALLRWSHPQRGTINPAEFIPIAEESGLILQIGEWVVRQACHAAATWPDAIKVAVNLSPVQFEREQVIPTVMSALASSGLAPERLELEVTETLLLTNTESSIATLRTLRALGVRIAMDDFGVGYSSLSHLRDFAFDKVKVDQSFVRSLSANDSSSAIVNSLSQLAVALGMTASAEGIETEEQLTFAKSNGVRQAQGFFFGRPIQERDVEDALRTLNPHLALRGVTSAAE